MNLSANEFPRPVESPQSCIEAALVAQHLAETLSIGYVSVCEVGAPTNPRARKSQILCMWGIKQSVLLRGGQASARRASDLHRSEIII